MTLLAGLRAGQLVAVFFALPAVTADPKVVSMPRSGVVRDAATKQPLRDVLILVWELRDQTRSKQAGRALLEVRSDSVGAYLVTPEVPATVLFWKEGYVFVIEDWPQVGGCCQESRDILLEPVLVRTPSNQALQPPGSGDRR